MINFKNKGRLNVFPTIPSKHNKVNTRSIESSGIIEIAKGIPKYAPRLSTGKC